MKARDEPYHPKIGMEPRGMTPFEGLQMNQIETADPRVESRPKRTSSGFQAAPRRSPRAPGGLDEGRIG